MEGGRTKGGLPPGHQFLGWNDVAVIVVAGGFYLDFLSAHAWPSALVVLLLEVNIRAQGGSPGGGGAVTGVPGGRTTVAWRPFLLLMWHHLCACDVSTPFPCSYSFRKGLTRLELFARNLELCVERVSWCRWER